MKKRIKTLFSSAPSFVGALLVTALSIDASAATKRPRPPKGKPPVERGAIWKKPQPVERTREAERATPATPAEKPQPDWSSNQRGERFRQVANPTASPTSIEKRREPIATPPSSTRERFREVANPTASPTSIEKRRELPAERPSVTRERDSWKNQYRDGFNKAASPHQQTTQSTSSSSSSGQKGSGAPPASAAGAGASRSPAPTPAPK